MSLLIYKDPELTEILSEECPDEERFNGLTGETKDRVLYLANKQTTLTNSITSTDTSLTFAQANFENGEIIRIGDETMTITAGGGTLFVNVTRGKNPTPHTSGLKVYSGYDFTGIKIEPRDITNPDESDWYRFALSKEGLDTATTDPVTLGDKPHNVRLTFWRRVIVPPNTPVQLKDDLRIRFTYYQEPIV